MTQLPPDPPEINVANAARGLPLTWMGVFLSRACGSQGAQGSNIERRGVGGQRGSGQPAGVYLSHTGVEKRVVGGATRIGTTRGRLFIPHRYRRSPVTSATAGAAYDVATPAPEGGIVRIRAKRREGFTNSTLPRKQWALQICYTPPSFRNRAQAPSHSRPQLDHN